MKSNLNRTQTLESFQSKVRDARYRYTLTRSAYDRNRFLTLSRGLQDLLEDESEYDVYSLIDSGVTRIGGSL